MIICLFFEWNIKRSINLCWTSGCKASSGSSITIVEFGGASYRDVKITNKLINPSPDPELLCCVVPSLNEMNKLFASIESKDQSGKYPKIFFNS